MSASTSVKHAVAIADLCDRQHFFHAVADRIWRAWWQPNGIPLPDIEMRLRENLRGDRCPKAFVTHAGDVLAGTASVVTSDLDERPNFTPWVAAVWVEPAFRSQGIARRLIDQAATYALRSGAARVYLTARPALRSFYTALGWTHLESEVGPRCLDVCARDA